MRQLEIVRKAMLLFEGSFINHNNEIILIPKFNVYTMLDDVETALDFKVKLCEWVSRDCCCAIRYSQAKRLRKYYQANTEKFNELCRTNFTVDEMELIYTKLGNGISRRLAYVFVASGFNLELLKGHPMNDLISRAEAIRVVESQLVDGKMWGNKYTEGTLWLFYARWRRENMIRMEDIVANEM